MNPDTGEREEVREAALRPLGPSGRGFWLLAAPLAALVAAGVAAYAYQLKEGLHVTGLNDRPTRLGCVRIQSSASSRPTFEEAAANSLRTVSASRYLPNRGRSDRRRSGRSMFSKANHTRYETAWSRSPRRL